MFGYISGLFWGFISGTFFGYFLPNASHVLRNENKKERITVVKKRALLFNIVRGCP